LRVINATHTFLHGTTIATSTGSGIDNSNSGSNESQPNSSAMFCVVVNKITREVNIFPKPKLTKMLCTTTNPEEKRKIIGDVFVHVANEAMAEMGLRPEEVFLGQGTLRPDLIESASALASSKADAIKTHHNDSELVRELRAKGRVVEPLKDFHKDEVRQLGCDLGLPTSLVDRHPFPGPGLAIRIICAEEAYMDKDFSETRVSSLVTI
jgi:GMP synthase (glutamine-hydrolysing)